MVGEHVFASEWFYSAGRASLMKETRSSAPPIRETLHSFLVLSTSHFTCVILKLHVTLMLVQ